MQEVLGRVPEPELTSGGYLVELLFQIGPAYGEAALTEGDLEPWERRRGILLSPWEAETVVTMSQAYLAESYNAREVSALCPWPKGVSIWKYVRDELTARTKSEEKETPHGSRKRHRNPAPR